jgi:translation initiation factor 2B subunit (eIF-2B alpha/beta/delta family)
MTIIEALYNEIDEIRNDNRSGSSELALKALEILTASMDLENNDIDIFPASIASMLTKTKPAMAAIKVICDYTLNDYRKSLYKGQKYFCKEVRNKMLRSNNKTMLKAYNTLFAPNPDKIYKIATCSYSSNVFNLLNHADEKGIKIQLFPLRSVWNDIDFSVYLVEKLSETGILSKIISFDEFENLRQEIDFCIIGADGYDFDNNVVNGLPSRKLAEFAAGYTDFFVVTESFKRTNKLKIDDGFEFIPSYYINDIISDDEQWHNEQTKSTEKKTEPSAALRRGILSPNL